MTVIWSLIGSLIKNLAISTVEDFKGGLNILSSAQIGEGNFSHGLLGNALVLKGGTQPDVDLVLDDNFTFSTWVNSEDTFTLTLQGKFSYFYTWNLLHWYSFDVLASGLRVSILPQVGFIWRLFQLPDSNSTLYVDGRKFGYHPNQH